MKKTFSIMIFVIYCNLIAYTQTCKIIYGVDSMPPSDAGVIIGDTIVCQSQNSVIYTVPLIIYASSYIWSLPTGATGVSTTNSIIVNYGASAISGIVNVYGKNSSWDGIPSSLSIIVNPRPPIPIISQNGNQLVSDAPNGNQWYVDNNIIQNATTQTYSPLSTGNYVVIVTLKGCASAKSNIIYSTDIEKIINNNFFSFFPNPATSQITIQIQDLENKNSEIDIQNILGEVVLKTKFYSLETIDISALQKGIYNIQLIKNNYIIATQKLVKQ